MRRLIQQGAQRAFAVPSLVYAGISGAPLVTPVPIGTLFTCSRGVASYPTPHRSHATKSGKKKKKFNYLTSDRLVANNRRKLSRKAVRARDDKGLARRHNYRRLLLQDVESKIRFFTPEIKNYVFFPSNKFNAKLLFRGNRVLVAHSFTRVYVSVLDQLKRKVHRDTLLSLMHQAGVEPPTSEEWARYTDKKTGDVNIGLLHSIWLKRYLMEIARKSEALLHDPDKAKRQLLTTSFLYIAVHLDEMPTLEDWSHKKGKLQAKELELNKESRSVSTVKLNLANAKQEITSYGADYVEEHVGRLTTEQAGALEVAFREHVESIVEKMNARLAFTAKVLLAVGELPEVKAIQSPMSVFFNRREMETILANKGSPYPPFKRNFAEWHQLPKEEKERCYCFARKPERLTKTGMQLYYKYCSRDYGILRSEATLKFRDLTDLQQAALNFPFYLPITPQRSTTVAFRKFYTEMCARYGLIRNGTATFGNRLFEAAMRKKWLALDPMERQQYDENDAIAAAFPLQPSGSKAQSRVSTQDSDDDDEEEEEGEEDDNEEDEMEEEEEDESEEEVEEEPPKVEKKRKMNAHIERKGIVVKIV